MATLNYKGKTFEVDEHDFLLDFAAWSSEFAEGTAQKLKMTGSLTTEHWDVIYFIRNTYLESGVCPLVYEACRSNGLLINELKNLFPTGYLRGACKLAGITYREGYISQSILPMSAEDLNIITVKKTYRVDVRGFLVDPGDWDEYYAAHRAYDMKIPGGKLTDRHWGIIHFLRDWVEKNHDVPTVYQVCEENGMALEELEALFPDGYHRGAIKIAGLRVR